MKILVTGFRPYATHEVNPSEEMLKRIHRDDVTTLLLPVEYDKAREILRKEIERNRPEAILLLALSPFIKRPNIEQYAYNEMDSVQADEKGVVKINEKIYPEGAPSYPAGFDTFSIQQYVLSQGEKCDIAIDPGRFVANAVYYEALHSGIPSMLVHLPQEINYPFDDTRESVEKILDYLDF